MSISKSITALLAGALEGAGLLDPEAPVAALHPRVGGLRVRRRDRAPPARHDHGDGVRRGLLARPRRARVPAVDRLVPVARASRRDLHAYLCTIRKRGGARRRGSTTSRRTPTCSAGCCERAERPAVRRRALALPVGAARRGADADITVDRLGAMRAAGGICVVPRDLAPRRPARGRGRRRRRAGRLRRATCCTGGDPALWAAGEFADFLPGGAYRSCLYQPRVEPGVAVGIGIFGQLLYADPARRVVVAKQSSWPTPDHEVADALAIDASRAIAAALAG